MRTFIAIELPTTVRQYVAALQSQLQTSLRQATIPDCFTWVPPEKSHITLRFLGQTTAQQAIQIQTELAALLQEQPPFPLTLQTVGAFPNFQRPNVLWLGIGGAAALLQALQAQVEALVQRSGFTPEARRFTPHLTLARAQRQALPAMVRAAGLTLQKNALDSRAAPFWSVQEVVHIESELRPEGARYTPLCHFGLKGKEK